MKYTKEERETRDYLIKLLTGNRNTIFANRKVDIFESLRDLGLCYDLCRDAGSLTKSDFDHLNIKTILIRDPECLYIFPETGESVNDHLKITFRDEVEIEDDETLKEFEIDL